MAPYPATDRPVPAVRAGFTLTELLVCVAALSVLAAMLVPAFARVGEKARLMKCTANLRALGVGLAAYLSDGHRMLPVADTFENPSPDVLEPLLGPYVGEAECFYCPSQRHADRRFSEENVQAGNIGYFYFSARQAPRDRAVSTFLRWEVGWPRELYAATDGDTWVVSDAWFSGESTAHWWYKRGVNHLTLGGEIRMVRQSPRQAFK